MARRWTAFDQATITREFRALPYDDYVRLSQAMLDYRLGKGVGYVMKNYGEGLMMVKDDSRGQGRCLFFAVNEVNGEEVLTALLVYKKETQEAPKRVLDTARRRMRDSK